MGDKRPTPEECGAFVSHNWVSIAGAAYRHYLKVGRGAILLDYADVQRWLADRLAGQKFTFEVNFLTTFDDDRVESLTATYDPETSIVAFFTTNTREIAVPGKSGTLPTGHPIGVWVFTDYPSPPESHLQTSN